MNDLNQQFEVIYRDNYEKVMRLCRGYASGDAVLAQDLVQEVFVKVWESLAKFKGNSQVSTWIYRIAVNTCLMRLRKKKRYLFQGELQNEVVAENEGQSSIKEQQFKKMYQCIAKLSSTNKSIILMELEGLSQKEIAHVMGMKHEAIRTRIHRIKIQLSKCVTHGGV